MLFVLVNCLHSKIELSVCCVTLSKPLHWKLNTFWVWVEISDLLQWCRTEHYWEQCLGASDGVAVHGCTVPGLYSCSWHLCICPSQKKPLTAVLVSQFKLYGSEEGSSFPCHCLQGREPFWWISDSCTPSSRFVFVCWFFFCTESHREILF